MFNNSTKLLFIFTTIFGTLISISASSWFTAWMGLEVNLLSFIPLMTENKMNSTEASLKYFLVQAIASAVLLFSFIVISIKLFSYNLLLMKMMILFSLIMKMGAAPFHFWFPNMIEGLHWNNVMLLMTWQKLAPMVLMMYIPIKFIFILSIILSLIVGTIGGLNQVSIRKILAYSSITHLSWMISAMYISNNLWLIYFLFYSFMTINLIIIFKTFNIFFINQLYSLAINSKIWKLMIFINFLSLGGLPPFMGFLPKWMVINKLVNYSNNMLLMLMLMMTLISLFYYLRLCYCAFMLSNYENNWMNLIYMNNTNQTIIMLMSFLNLTGLMMITFMYMLM